MPWLSAGSLLLVVLNHLLDETFWRGLVTLLGVFTVFGVLLNIALGLTVTGENGWAFYGVTRLTEMGGPDLNPEYAMWWIPLLVTAFLKFAVPIALTVTLAWLVAVRSNMSRWERAGLVLVTARFGLLLFDAPSYLLAYLTGGAFMGIPAWRIALGALPAIAAFVVVGSGGFAGLVTGGKALFGVLPVVRAGTEGRSILREFVDALRTKPGDTTLDDRGLGVFIGESARRLVRRPTKFTLVVVGVPVLLTAWGAFSSPPGPLRHVATEHIVEEVPLDFAADAVYHADGTEVWLHLGDGTVRRADLAAGQVDERSITTASGLTVHHDAVFALVPGNPAAVVELTKGRPKELFVLPGWADGVLAVDETSVYVGNDDGRLARFARDTGDVVNVVETGMPVSRVMVGGGAVWTLHTPPDIGPADGNYRAVRRDPNTLSQAGEQPPQVLLTDLAVSPDGTGWVAMGNALLPFPFDGGTAAGTTQSDELVDVDGTILTGRDIRSAWLALPHGETVHVTEDEAERRDFHYDRLRGVVTTNSATWFLVERDDWLFGSADDARRGLLVRWDG